MGKYQSYADRLDSLVRKRFSDFEKVAESYEKAKKAKEDYPIRYGFGISEKYQLQALKADVGYKEAEIEYKLAKETLANTLNEAKELRSDLLEEISKDYSAKPSDLDRNVVDLLQSGICSCDEIMDLYSEARNATTKRYIGKFAKDEYDKLSSNREYTNESPEGIGLRAAGAKLLNVVEACKMYEDPESSREIQFFDAVIDGALSRTINNTSMIGDWGTLTEKLLAEF